jgi:hypothetical protein
VYDPLAVTTPVPKWRVTPRGHYGALRDGGVVHLGLDMSVRYVPDGAGWDVVAPERMVVRYVDRDADADASPLGNYGPGSVAGEGQWPFGHILAHLDVSTIPAHIVPGYVLQCGEFVGRISKPENHVHWEVRFWRFLSARGADRARYTWSPLRWLAYRQALAGAAVGVALVKLPFLLVAGLAGALEVVRRNAVARGSRDA